MDTVKQNVEKVFDEIAEKKMWESLYSGEMSFRNYNFFSRKRTVEQLLEAIPVGRVLDLGCGTGDFLPYFAARTMPYVGVDLSAQMISRAKANYAKYVETQQAAFEVGDSESIKYDTGFFDIVVAIALIEYFSDPSKVVAEIARVTKSGGNVIITVPNKDCINNIFVDIVNPIRKLLVPFYSKFTKAPLTKMGDIVHYRHSPSEIEALMKRHGFSKAGEGFSNFNFIFYPVGAMVPRAHIYLSEKAAGAGRADRFRLFASNYIGLYRKDVE